MFLVPPPPPSLRYPSHQDQPGTAQAAVHARTYTPTLMEVTNVLSHPVGPSFQFTAGEGTYVLKDDLQLSTPPPHPSEAQPANPNPLTTTIAPPTLGTRLSLVTTSPPSDPPAGNEGGASLTTWTLGRKPHSIKESSREGRSSSESTGQRASTEAPVPFPTTNGHARVGQLTTFGDSNALLAPPLGSDAPRRRKPKNNIIKSNSSFVSRVIPHEHFPKKATDRDHSAAMVFANINRGFQWLDLGSKNMAEHITKILFTRAHALCHDVNQVTKSASHLDVVLGFSTGDIIWYEPMSQKYARLNKTHTVNPHPILDIRWVPGSENLFIAAHSDGALVVYDKEREDAAFAPEEQEMFEERSLRHSYLQIRKSVNSQNQKANPVAYWQLASQQLNAFAFSPDGKRLAAVSEDGSLRVIDMMRERLLDMYSSYYGGLHCVAWSPDGKYIVTGGQDDLVSVWSMKEGRIVARCQGHQSWVTSVAFDPWRCDERNYRFGSVGEDCRMLLWDFSVGMLHRPKASMRHHGSISSHAGPPVVRTRAESVVTTATSRLRSGSNVTAGTNDEDVAAYSVRHPVEPRARTAVLPPIMSKVLDKDPLSWIGFEEKFILTACSNGHIRTWIRPTEQRSTTSEPGVEASQ